MASTVSGARRARYPHHVPLYPARVHPVTSVPPRALHPPVWCVLLFEPLPQASHLLLWAAHGGRQGRYGYTHFRDEDIGVQREEVTFPGFLCRGHAGHLAPQREREHEEREASGPPLGSWVLLTLGPVHSAAPRQPGEEEIKQGASRVPTAHCPLDGGGRGSSKESGKQEGGV